MKLDDDQASKRAAKRRPLPLVLLGLAVVGYAVIAWQWL
jgi:hypothetical protein